MTTPTGILFEEPINQPLSSNGLPQAGCYYCFFLTGTTTPAAVYANGTLATPLSQPTAGSVNPSAGTVANASGQFVAIYLNPGTIYRRQLYSANGTLLSDVDPIVPALVQLGAAQTFTAAQTITPGSGTALTVNAASGAQGLVVNGAANQYAAQLNGSSTVGESFGLLVAAGTNSSDDALLVESQSGTTYFRVRGDGAIGGYGTTAAGLVDMTPDSGSFTGSLTGCTTTPTATCKWQKVGNLVFLFLGAMTGTSNSTSCTITGLPAEIQPPTLPQNLQAALFLDNSALVNNVTAQVNNGSGTIPMLKGGSATGFTASGTKGTANITICYMLI